MDFSKNKNKIIWAAVLVLVVLIVGVYMTKDKETESIKIGVVAPMTGGAAVYGNSLVKGIEMAKNDLKGTDNNYEVIFEDDGTNPSQSASAASKLVNIDKVSAIITVTSGTGNAVKPIATAAKVIHICVCSDPSVGDGVYNFTNVVIPVDEAPGWVNEANARGIKKIAILAQNQPGYNAIIDELKKKADQAGIQTVFHERFDPTTKDFKTMISKAAATNPDIYFIGAFPPSLDIVAKELKNYGIPAEKISNTGTLAISADIAQFNGAWYSDSSIADPTFKERFEKAYPEVRFNIRTAPYGYDTFNILTNGFESKNISTYLSGLSEYNGKVGKVTKESGSGNFRSGVSIWTIKDGKAEFVK